MKNCNKTPHNGSREKMATFHNSFPQESCFSVFNSSIFLFGPVSFRVSKGVNVYTFCSFGKSGDGGRQGKVACEH